MPSTRPTAAAPVRPVVLLLGVLALAANLRAALAGYPPLLETARAELGISASAAGLAQTGAVLAMAAGSFAGAAIGARFGHERALAGAVGLVAVGSLVRGLPTFPALVGGSVAVGAGIGVAGVGLTGVVKDRLTARAGAVTGGYVVAMLVGATAASAAAVPLAVLLGGWSLALAAWAVPALLAVAVWTPVARRMPRPDRDGPRSALPWRDPFARWACCYQAGTSLLVYGWMTWLPPYYQGQGFSPALAGLLLGGWSIAQMPAALLVPALAERSRRWGFWASAMLGCIAAGTLGALLLPLAPLVGPWLWIALIGIGSGAGFPLGLAVIAWRTPDGAASAATSGLALGVGYTVAGLGPLLMGVLIDVTGGYAAAIGLLLAAAAGQALAVAGIVRTPVPDAEERVTG
jgi:MFS transporter, CP family, cyanate transporter